MKSLLRVLSFTLVLLGLFWSLPGFADSPIYDSTNAINLFRTTMGEKSILFTGRHYRPHDLHQSEGHAFFLSPQWQNGLVTYDGNIYDTRLKYEIVEDLLLVPFYTNENVSIELCIDKVSNFSFSGHQFIRLSASPTHFMQPGFYEVLYEGDITILSKKRKEIKESIENLVVQYVYSESVEYYIKMNNRYNSITSLSSVLKLMPEQKKEIKRYLRKNNVNFNKNKEDALKIIGELYNQLTHQK